MAFDPSILQPAGQMTAVPPEMLGMTQEQYQSIPIGQRPTQQAMQTPDGNVMYKRSGPDGTYYETPRVGETAVQFRQGQDGSWTPAVRDQGGWSQLGKNVYQDPKFMSFLVAAAGGAVAASYMGAGTAAAGGATGAGGAGLGSAAGYSDLAGLQGLNQVGLTTAGSTGVGTGAVTAGLGSAGSAGGFFDQAGNFIKNNPGIVGAGLGALAGAASGSVDMTSNRSNTSEMQSGNIGKIDSNSGLVGYAQPAGQAYAGMAQDTINGKYLGQGLGTNPYAGPNAYLGQAMDNVASRMTDSYKNGTAAQSMGQFQQGGAFGGSAHQQFMEGQNRAFGDSLGSTLNNMQMQDYTQQQQLGENQLNRQLSQFQSERNNMMGAAGGLSQLGQQQSQTSANNAWSANRGNETSTINGVGPVQGALAGAVGGWAMGNQAAAPSQQPVAGYLGSQPMLKNQQYPAGAVSYNQPRPTLGSYY